MRNIFLQSIIFYILIPLVYFLVLILLYIFIKFLMFFPIKYTHHKYFHFLLIYFQNHYNLFYYHKNIILNSNLKNLNLYLWITFYLFKIFRLVVFFMIPLIFSHSYFSEQKGFYFGFFNTSSLCLHFVLLKLSIFLMMI